jgi:uncharacterized paraquat-inducible protein A
MEYNMFLDVIILIVAVATWFTLQNRNSAEQLAEQNRRSNSKLTTCPDCEGFVSRQAITCPHCGRPFTPQLP